jgi:inositol oxygenase
MNSRSGSENPLRRLEDWEDFVEARYPAPGAKPREDYRNYVNPSRDTVRDFYRLNHRHQTYDFVRQKKQGHFSPIPTEQAIRPNAKM